MTPRLISGQTLALASVLLALPLAAEDTVSTAVYAKIGNGYQRERLPDGSFKPEFYALSNGGRIAGTRSDTTTDRVTYPEVAEIAARFLAQQKYHYAQSKDQAKLLLVLNWGATSSYNSANYGNAVKQLSNVVRDFSEKKMYQPTADALGEPVKVDAMVEQLLMIKMENRARDAINLPNAKVIGYLDDINKADGIQRWAGGGDRYNDLIADLEDPRYYIVVSAYDFAELEKRQKKKLLWQVRVSVRSAGNKFDDSFVPMLKTASAYFGRESGGLMRGEETKVMVGMGEIKFLGEAKEEIPSPTKEKK